MTPNIFPALRYRDGHAAIDWLVRAFGFEKQAVFDAPGRRRRPRGAALRRRRDRPQLGEQHAGRQPVGHGDGRASMSASKEVDAHHDRAAAAGADIVTPLTDQSYGSREYAARDPEGHLWGFGTYDMQAPEGEPNIFVGLHYHDGPGGARVSRARLRIPEDVRGAGAGRRRSCTPRCGSATARS